MSLKTPPDGTVYRIISDNLTIHEKEEKDNSNFFSEVDYSLLGHKQTKLNIQQLPKTTANIEIKRLSDNIQR